MDGLTYALSQRPRRDRIELWLIEHLLCESPLERRVTAWWHDRKR